MNINTEGLPVEVAIKNIDQYSPQQFTQIRRIGFGGSDASALINMNPYNTFQDIVDSKVRTEITDEEIAVSQNRNVRAGTDLEPTIIEKFNENFPEFRIFKPKDMYRFRDFPYLTMNFDGVGINPEGTGYVPIEIKYISRAGGKYYKPENAWWLESVGFVPGHQDLTQVSSSIQTRAEASGVPKYYYPQLQQEMAALNASYGLLAAFDDKSWSLWVFRSRFDPKCFDLIATNGAKAWADVTIARARLGLNEEDYIRNAGL